MEGQEGQSKQGLLVRIGKVVVRELRGAWPTLEKIKLKEIDESSVSKTIYWQIGGPHMRLVKDPWANHFTIVDVLANMGYVGTLVNTDYRQKFPEAYQRTRVVLQKLTDQGVLEIFSASADSNKETLEYKVKDENLLKNLADKLKGQITPSETIQR